MEFFLAYIRWVSPHKLRLLVRFGKIPKLPLLLLLIKSYM